MYSLKKFPYILLFFVMLFTYTNNLSAQCNSFAKKKCLPSLSPYTHNGQLNSTQLGAGETAELAMTFYSGQNYRLKVCHDPSIEGVYFKLKDSDHKELYNSHDKDSQHFDFNVKSTQQMFIEVVVPDHKDGEHSKGGHDITHSGCVSVLVGFKP
jgi:hypothetical protein